jgi:hypothetical protein
MEKTKRLLWLSDIHFRDKYDTPDYRTYLDSYLQGFVETIEKYVTKNGNLDYILLSGDIAFSGIEDDYTAFNKMVLTPLISKLEELGTNKTKIICIPGNHDISRKEFPSEWKQEAKNTASKRYTNRNKTLNEKISDFQAQFRDYTLFCKYILRGNSINSDSDKDTYKKNNNLHGIYFDHDLKLKFFMLNSAWYCINAQQANAASSWTKKELLEINNISQEFGGLIVGQDLIKEDVETIINEHTDYNLITMIHHPLHWLFWGELYSYNEEGSENFPLNKLLKYTDVLLSGHEHLPIGIKTKKIDDNRNSYHFMAGQFLEDTFSTSFSDTRFQNNRFSILEIGEDELKEIRFLYKGDSWHCKDEHSELFHLEDSNERPYTNEADRFLEMKNIDISNLIIRYCKEEHDISITYNKKSSEEENANYHIFNNESACWIVVTPKQRGFHSKTIHDKSFINELREVLSQTNYSNKKLYVCFFCLDVLAGIEEKPFAKAKTKVDIIDIFNPIVEQAENSFKIFKHEFYIFEGNNDEDKPFNSLQEVEFINIILPYWNYDYFL